MSLVCVKVSGSSVCVIVRSFQGGDGARINLDNAPTSLNQPSNAHLVDIQPSPRTTTFITKRIFETKHFKTRFDFSFFGFKADHLHLFTEDFEATSPTLIFKAEVFINPQPILD